MTFVHTLLANKEITKTEKVMVLLPVNVQTNWRNEISKWTDKCQTKIKVYELPNDIRNSHHDKVNHARIDHLERWRKNGGVFLIGYIIFSRLVQSKNVKPKSLLQKFQELLFDTADLVVFDEGHLLKNDASSTSKSAFQIKTPRRIVLTGTPLQNNLTEYHCMVSFVKPNLLGNKKEFNNRFANPINAGQMKDSTESDVRIMKKRAHVLHNLLDGCVQRKDYNVIKSYLMPKKEYVISIRLSDQQIELYRKYLTHRGIENIDNLDKIKGAQLFLDFNELSSVWTHPWVLKLKEIRLIRAEDKKAEKDFIAEGDELDEEMDDENSNDRFSSTTKSNDLERASYLDFDEDIEDGDIGSILASKKP